MNYLDVSHLKKRFEKTDVLHDISFSVKEGEVVSIIGPSGSGKSTITKLLQMLYAPESGRILVDGVDMVSEVSVVTMVIPRYREDLTKTQ